MLFIEWWLVRRIFIVLLIVAVAIFSFWFVRKKGLPVRVPVRLLSALVVLCGVLALLFLWWAVTSSHVWSMPVYSPDRKMAVRIDEYNASGFGGADDSVEVFTAHGFNSDVVFSGDWKSVETADIRWKSDSELEISHEGTVRLCTSTPRVKVRCISR